MPTSELPKSLVPEIRALIEDALGNADVPGTAVGIVLNGELAGFVGQGTAHVGTDETPTELSIARVASVTKTFTATAIMQLRDASLLELDDPLLLHIPEFTSAQAVAAPLEAVTIRRLLTHHSGLSTEHPDVDWDTPEFPMLERVMDSLDLIKVVIPQDSQWKYSNLGYCLLGEVISRLSGKPYIDYVHDEIFEPLGLENTAFDLSEAQQKLKMTGYSPPLPGETEVRVAPVAHLNGFSAVGQLQTNVTDLAKWIGFQLGDGPESVLSKASRSEMQRPVYIAGDWSSGQGLGWRAYRKGEHVYWNHGGAVHGFSTSVVFNVPARVGVIALMNRWPVSMASDLTLNIVELLANRSKPDAQPGQIETVDAVPGDFDGEYWSEPGLPITVLVTKTGIAFKSARSGEPTLHAASSLDPAAEDDTFTVTNGRAAGETAVFARSESGDVTGFTLGGFRYRKIG